VSRLRQLVRVLRPVSGALANAGDAVHADRLAAERRHRAALSQARVLGPASWSPLTCEGQPLTSAHGLHLCEDEAEQLAQLCDYVLDGLDAGDVCVVVATAPHLAGLHQRLALTGGSGVSRRLHTYDADALLSHLLRDGCPDEALFDRVVGDVVRRLADQGRPVRAYGEMVDLLQARGDLLGALELEALWEQLLTELPFTLLCAYHLGDDAGGCELVRAAHTYAVV
jgi:hypothetical protein